MKKIIMIIWKSIAIQIAAFSVICWIFVLVISFPTNTSAGQTSVSKFQSYFNSIFWAISFSWWKASTTTPTMSGHIATKWYVDNITIDAKKINSWIIHKDRLDKAPMPNNWDNSDKIATTAWVKANTASPASTNNYFCIDIKNINDCNNILSSYWMPNSLGQFYNTNWNLKSNFYNSFNFVYCWDNFDDFVHFWSLESTKTATSFNYIKWTIKFCYASR